MTEAKNTPQLKQLTFGDHICLLYDNMDSYREIAVRFILEGLYHKEKVYCIIDEYPKELLIADLRNEHSNDIEGFLTSGQLVITTIQHVYKDKGFFDCDKPLAHWKKYLEELKKESFNGLRIMGEMAFAVDGTQKSLDGLMEYEVRSNTETMPLSQEQLWMCVFDKKKFPAYIVEDMVKKHNVIIHEKEIIKPNPYYIDPSEQLRLHEEKMALRRRLAFNSKWNDKILDEKNEKKNRDLKILKHVLRATGDGTWEWNVETNEFYMSEEFLDILDCRADKILKDRGELVKLIHPEDFNILLAIMDKCCKNEMEHFDYELRIRKGAGEWIWLRVRGVAIQRDMASGKLLRLVGVFNNITEHKKVQKELEEKVYFEKLRTEFFANLSHELRTPINVILGSIQLQDLYLKEDQSSKYIDKYITMQKRMKHNCYRLLRLVNNMIDITRIDAGFYTVIPQNIDIIKLLRGIVQSVEDYVENAGLRVSFNANIDQLIMACDPEKIERAVLNLLANATKFTEAGGKVDVSMSEENNQVMIRIKDTGRGIPQEKLEDIFNRFSQVDKSLSRNHEGSGIGLALTKSIVEMHKGAITVKSELNRGSEFTIALPIEVLDKEICLAEIAVASETNVERIHIEFSDIYF